MPSVQTGEHPSGRFFYEIGDKILTKSRLLTICKQRKRRVMNLQRNINKEIRGYEEEVFMGLSLRQLLCSIVAIGVAVGVYYGFRDYLGQETVSWVCIVAAVPVAAAGFLT